MRYSDGSETLRRLRLRPLLGAKRNLSPVEKRDAIYHDVDGAPFKIGDIVKVVLFSDDSAGDEFLGRVGIVLYFKYSCGCGQSFPADPMIGIQFGEKTAEFWKEEITKLNQGNL